MHIEKLFGVVFFFKFLHCGVQYSACLHCLQIHCTVVALRLNPSCDPVSTDLQSQTINKLTDIHFQMDKRCVNKMHTQLSVHNYFASVGQKLCFQVY